MRRIEKELFPKLVVLLLWILVVRILPKTLAGLSWIILFAILLTPTTSLGTPPANLATRS
jgi:hypothetical protein